MLGIIPSLVITLFLGVGTIIAGNAGDLPNQKLPLRTDGCYLNTTESLRSYPIESMLMKANTAWKDEEYSTLTNLFSISYLWQPMITLFSTVIFGLLFSLIINVYKRSPPVKEKYMTPIIVSMWKAILGKERLESWIEFEEDDINDNKSKKDSETFGMGTIPRVTLDVSGFAI